MSLQSMTGFAREDDSSYFGNWTWELRSVNGKGLDMRLRLPNGLEDLDNEVRKLVSKSLKRGNLQISLQFQKSSESEKPVVNEALADDLWQAATTLKEKFGGDMPSIAELMSMRGVVEVEEAELSDEDRARRNHELLESFGRTLDELVAVRRKEGSAIAAVLSQQVDQIEKIREKIDKNDARSETSIRAKLSVQVQQLIDANNGLDEQRLHQEAVLMAAKADLQEEIDRLAVHVASAREMLAGNGPIGRKMDFLAQEFNRECNTICSKSNDAGVTTLGLDMKIVIDQFREQIQNME
ncbi:MAG: YicC/YloC family endoribonuclease [Rhizobiaceae bacterium]|nr:YicC/YloC family endoribonuclease [Rhizobiaceae bacterium]